MKADPLRRAGDDRDPARDVVPLALDGGGARHELPGSRASSAP